MKKICFVLSGNSATGFSYLGAFNTKKGTEEIKNYFSDTYQVVFNCLEDGKDVDYIIVPDPFTPIDNKNNIPIIKVPTELYFEKNLVAIRKLVDSYVAKTN
ncbi:type 2 periplasmic-binding domain-containing protein [Enterococcus sp. LJL90]